MTNSRDKLAGKTTKLAGLQERLEDHPAALNNYAEGSFYQIDIGLIRPNPDQRRKYFNPDTLEELSASIRERGVLQPVIIRKTDAGEVFLVAGERRLKAAKMAGLEKIPAILTKGHPAEISLIENLQREDLKPIEEAEALHRMTTEYSYTHEQLAQVIGKARSTITETMSLMKLPEEIKKECRRADIYPRRLLIEIAKQETPEQMLALFRTVTEGNLKSDQVREVTRKKRGETRQPVALALERVTALQKSLQKIHIDTADREEALAFLSELQKLRVLIEEILNQ